MRISRTASILGITAVAAVVLAAWVASRSMGGARAPAAPRIPVAAATVKRLDVRRELAAVGTVQSLISVTLHPQIDGVLTEVLVREGQSVAQGQLLARIDDRALSASVAQARAEQARNAASLEIAKLNLQRDENLLAEQAISRQTVEEQRALTRQIEAALLSNEAAVRSAEIQRSYARIVSPVAGKVGMRRVDPGNLIRANDSAGLFTVVQVDPISVVFSLPQQDLANVQELLSSPDAAEVTVFDRATGTLLATGILAAADNQVDPATGTIQLRARFPNPAGRLWPGEFVTVKLRTGIDRGATAVASQAVQRGLDGNFVFRVRNEVAEPVPVRVRYESDAIAAVDAGLKPGDVVVVEGQAQLKSGSFVRLVSIDADPPAAPARRSSAR